jgi:soluble lytic murein transglycosylase
MVDLPIQPNEAEIIDLAQQPGIQRAIELFHIGETTTANREWYYTTRNLSESQWQAAAELANRHQWDNRSIMSMIKASYWNDMSLRFPLTYQPPMTKAGKQLNVESNLLLAIARQESALSPNAVSPAGARGLMQMMPATAKNTARKFGIKYRNSNDLFNVDKNIDLCSKYYKQLLEQFNNNRIVASAGYNAGPHRANRWLEKSDGLLDFDMWVETIPFKETRGYVQNILAFSAIYKYRMGQIPQMLTPHERAQKL